MLQFWLWWVLVASKHGAGTAVVQYTFPIAGHTKTFCDGCFGLIKRKFKRSTVHTPADFYRVVNESGKPNTAVCSSQVTFLSRFFKPRLVKISSFQLFKFGADRPGVLLCKEMPADPWQERPMFLPSVTPETVLADWSPQAFPAELKPMPEVHRKGMDDVLRTPQHRRAHP